MSDKWPNLNVDIFKIKKSDIKIKIENINTLEVEFYNYSLKYKESANEITKDTLIKCDISQLDFYFYSIAFLYRHSIELILKAIGFKYMRELEERKRFIIDTFHNLSEILETISPYIQNLVEIDMDAYNWILTYLKDIEDIDKESDSFRYPFAIKYNDITDEYSVRIVFNKQTHINLKIFAKKMEVVYEILNSIFIENYGSNKKYLKYKPVFIEEGGNYYEQSVVCYKYRFEKFYPFLKAYNDSAMFLYKRIIECNDLKENLFIPMFYLYRNTVELYLKAILFEECSYSLQLALNYMKKKKHKVLGLWNLIKDEIKEHANASDEDETLLVVEKYIKILNNLDGSSDKFRYPTNKKLDFHFNYSRLFDIDIVNSFFKELLNFLSCVRMMMSANNEMKAEMEAEMRAEMEAEMRAEMEAYYRSEMMYNRYF